MVRKTGSPLGSYAQHELASGMRVEGGNGKESGLYGFVVEADSTSAQPHER